MRAYGGDGHSFDRPWYLAQCLGPGRLDVGKSEPHRPSGSVPFPGASGRGSEGLRRGSDFRKIPTVGVAEESQE